VALTLPRPLRGAYGTETVVATRGGGVRARDLPSRRLVGVAAPT